MDIFSFLFDIVIWTGIGAFAGYSVAEQGKYDEVQRKSSVLTGVGITLFTGILTVCNYGLPDIGLAEHNTFDVLLVAGVFFLVRSPSFRHKLRRKFRTDSIQRTYNQFISYLNGEDYAGYYH